jgi:hypothetical protein
VNALLEAPPIPISSMMDIRPDEAPLISPTRIAPQVQMPPTITQQRETKTKDGKRRIQPRSVSAPVMQPPNVLQPAPMFDLNNEPHHDNLLTSVMEARSDGGVTRTSFEQPTAPIQSPPKVPVVRRVEALVSQSPDNTAKVTITQPRTEAPVLEIDIQPIYLRVNENEEFKCTIDGHVEYIVKGKKAWGAFVWGGPVMAATTNTFVAVCCVPNVVHVFLRSGRRVSYYIII